MRFSTFSSLGSPPGRAQLHGQIAASRADARADRLRRQRDIDAQYDTQERIDRLTLVCLAMWELVREHTDLTDEDLRAKVEEIDTADGRRDGFHRPAADRCGCGAAVAAGAPRCQFCGAEAPDRSPFKAV